MGRLPFPGRLSPPDRQGRRWLTRCHAWRLPVTDLYAPDVLAGLVAGARRRALVDGIWLVLPRTESVLKLLAWWGVSVCQESKPGELLISPFYGVLLSRFMPAACAMSMVVRRAGNCPLLPLAIYNALFGPGNAGEGYLLPQDIDLEDPNTAGSPRPGSTWPTRTRGAFRRSSSTAG